ncbi:MAG: YihY/virulence factor BrkB family protein [Chloroflexi bacterium]|nr:YihY/virulence factor BrkB family protein [Chloroflexota bacterium]
MKLELWRQSRGLLRWLRRMRSGWLGVGIEAWRRTFTLESSLVAAALAYFSLFSFFPLLIFTTMLASTSVGSALDRSEIIAQISFIAPALSYLLESQLQRIVEMEQSITGLAVVSLLWSASSIFYVLTRTVDGIWSKGRTRPIWQHRGRALGSVIVISVLLLLASLAHGTVVAIVNVFFPTQLQPLTNLLSQLVVIVVGIALFAIVYRFLPSSEVSWRDVWPGAVVGGLLWEVLKRVFLFYATNYLAQPNLTQLIYGSLATIVAFMTWAYASSIILIYGAYLNVVLGERRPVAEVAQTQVARL